MASTLSNLYVEKASSEHPLALWMLNEQVDYVSQITEDQRQFEAVLQWDLTNAQAEFQSSNEVNAPFLDSHTSRIKGSLPLTASSDILLVSDFLLSDNLVEEYANFNIGFYILLETARANTISVGYKYTDVVTNETVEVLSTKNVSSRYKDNWVFISNTFDLPPDDSIAENIKIVIKVNVSQGGVEGAYDFLLNGLSVGQWSEEFNKTSYGVIPDQIPTNIALPSQLKCLPAFPYGASGQNGYYLSQDYRLFAKNFGVPLVFGSSNVTKLTENVYNSINYPSLIFPGYGFLNKRGRYNDYTIEMWVRINSKTLGTKRIFGPIASTDGLYVDEAFLTLKIGTAVVSHFVGDWFRPMLIHIRVVGDSVFLVINGEEVGSVEINQETISLPDEFDNLKRSQDWIGFYAYEDIRAIEVDTFSIYSYAIPTTVAKKRWVWGQAVTAPEQTNSSLNSVTAFNDYAFADYAANYNYPDFANWKQAYFSNVNAERKALSLPEYSLPDFRLKDKSVKDLFDAIKLMPSNPLDKDDVFNREYITLSPNQQWNSESDYIYFENFGVLNEPVQTVYGVFKTDGTEINKTLIKITNKTNNNSIKIFITNLTVTYQRNIDGVSYALATRTVNANEKFSVGLDISKLLKSQDSAINRFFTEQSFLDMYVAGDGASKFNGKIYKIGFDAAYNSRRTSWMYDDDGIIFPNISYTITDVGSKSRLFGGTPSSVLITDIDVPNSNPTTGLSYRVTGGLAPLAGDVTAARTLPKESLYVAVATGGTSTIAYSTDGANWLTSFIPGGTKIYRSVVYGNGKFVAVGSTNTTAYSEDGINWTASALPSNGNWTSVVYGNNKFVTMGNNSNNTGASSTDGITWTSFDCPQPGPASLAYGGGKFVAVFFSISTGQYSEDGINWTQFNMPSGALWDTVVYGNDRFVAISRGAPAAYSLDGITWTASNMPSSGTWNSLTFGNGKFVAVKQNSRDAAYSTDGITWTASSLPVGLFNPSWTTVTYGDGKFVAMSTTSYSADNINVNKIAAYSTNGIDWTLSLAPLRDWSSVTHGTPTNVFITIGNAKVEQVQQVGTTQVWNARLTGLNPTEVAKLRIGDEIIATPGVNGKLTFTTSETHNYLIGDSITTTGIISSPANQLNFSEQEVVSLTDNTFTINSNIVPAYISGGKASDTTNILHDHTANYTLTAVSKYSLLFPDIAVAGYWEDYMPLSYFSKSITDFDFEQNYEIDTIQYNQDFPQPPKSAASLEVSTWNYGQLRAAYSAPVILTYEDLNNEFYTGWDNYEEMSQNAIRTSFYDTKGSTLRSYVSFQPILNGANKSLADFESFAKPLTSGIIDPAATSLDWEKTAFETTSGTVIYPPVRTFSSNKSIDFEKYALVYHLDFKSDGIFHNPVRFRELQLASQVLERTDFTPVGSRFGIPVYYYLKRGLYFDLKGKNPISTYKKSTPYLYLDRNSGWKIQGEFDSETDRGIAIPVNLSQADDVEVSSIQMWVRFSDRDFPLDPVMIFSIDHNDGIYDFFIQSDASEKRGFIFAVDRDSAEIIDEIQYYINGQSVGVPLLVRDEWAVLGLEFGQLLNFSSGVGLINLNGPLTYNNVSYNLATNIEKSKLLETRAWADMPKLTVNNITGIQTSVVNNISYVTYSTNSGTFTQGQKVSVVGVSPPQFNFANLAITSTSGNSFTVASTATGSYGNGGTVESGSWSKVRTSFAIPPRTTSAWQQVKAINESITFDIDPKAIYEKYTGSNRIVIDDNSSGIFIDPERIKIFKDVSWSENLKVPV
jgi:hypothetical protein